jgi:hypothetical protein
MKFSYANKRDRKAGADQAGTTVDRAIEGFDRIPKDNPCRLNAWKAFVDLAQAQAPFDMESGAAQVIARELRHRNLIATYRRSVAIFPDRCRSRLLDAMVQENQCIRAAGGEKTGGEAMLRCVRNFNYEKCIGMKSD